MDSSTHQSNHPSPRSPEPDAPQFVEQLILKAEKVGASDIHLHRLGTETQIAFRLDGVLCPTEIIRDPLAERVFGRVKYLSRLKTYQDQLPQDGRIDHREVHSQHDLRVATYPTVTGEKMVLRLFRQDTGEQLQDLDLPPDIRAGLEQVLRSPQGLILLTGPSGSGKTTTIYACLRYIQSLGGRHIITVEDPVEQILPGLMQTETNEALQLDFARAARHLLRQDPQVLVVGEIRDEQTANVAVRAALTGHLVISTLHAGSCRGVLERLQDLCDDRNTALASLSLILNQRLIRKLCPACTGKGCSDCLQSGYRGRLPLIEMLRLDDALRRRIRQTDDLEVQPPCSLAEMGRTLMQKGMTDLREVERCLGFSFHSTSPPVTSPSSPPSPSPNPPATS